MINIVGTMFFSTGLGCFSGPQIIQIKSNKIKTSSAHLGRRGDEDPRRRSRSGRDDPGQRGVPGPGSPSVLQLRHPVAPEKAEQRRRGGVALRQHISCKFMQNSESAAGAAAAAAAVLHSDHKKSLKSRPRSPGTRLDTAGAGGG